MTIEPERIQAIEKIQMPSNKKGMQSFLGKINFVKRFVLVFSKVVRPMQNMIKKVVDFKWNELEKEAFVKIKRLIAESPALLSPDFNKEFYLYTFASDLSYAGVLTQRNDQGEEVPILVTSLAFTGVELNYPKVEKQAYVIFKAVKHFRPYFLKSKTNVIVPFLAVRNFLVQKDPGEKRANWVIALQEYDLEIKLSKIVRGQGLCKLVVEGNDDEMRAAEEEKLELEEGIFQAAINIIEQRQDSWYSDLKQLLITGAPLEGLNPKQKRALRLKSEPYQLIQGILFRSNREGVLLRCLEKEDSERDLNEFHQGPAGGHFGGDTTVHKILRVGYYWPTLFRDAHALARKCIKCQKCAGRYKKAALPLQPVMIEKPFQQWGLDVVGPIALNSSAQHRYILTAMDYFKIWAEATLLRVINSDNSTIISRFGLPEVLVFDNASYFNSVDLSAS